MADHGPVKIREGKIEQLLEVYRRVYARMAQEIVSATEAGKIQRARVMARINAELTSLGVDVDEWVKQEIPQYYLDGANQAVQDLRALGVDVSKSSQFAVINREAIKALTDDVALNFAQAITAMSRSARVMLNDAFRQQVNQIIAEGRLSGDTRREISSNIKARIQAEGITSIKDKAGRDWSFDRYAEMLARTKAVEARNQGLVNRMLGSGYDLVQVTNHRTDHEACAAWEGRILSLSGNTPGYPTVQEAMEAGLFHPNCKHAMNAINPEIAALTQPYANPYNYRDNAATGGPIRQATGGPTMRQQVYHGSGKAVMPSGDNLFGDAFYVTTDPKVARVFGGTVASKSMTISKGQILNINDQEHYQQLIREVLAAYPGQDPQKAIPKFARALGYKAISAGPGFDELGGIAILDRAVLR